MSEKSRAYEKKRYLRDRKKRIAAERAYERSDPKHKAKKKMRNATTYAVQSGKLKKPKVCPNCGSKNSRIEWDHATSKWKCSKCHARGGAVK